MEGLGADFKRDRLAEAETLLDMRDTILVETHALDAVGMERDSSSIRPVGMPRDPKSVAMFFGLGLGFDGPRR